MGIEALTWAIERIAYEDQGGDYIQHGAYLIARAW